MFIITRWARRLLTEFSNTDSLLLVFFQLIFDIRWRVSNYLRSLRFQRLLFKLLTLLKILFSLVDFLLMFFYANHHALESSIFMGVTTFVEEIHEQMFFFEETELSAVAFA